MTTTAPFVPGSGVSWSAGGNAKPSPRVDKLARLYHELETIVNPDEYLRLAAAFAELRAPCHVAKCHRLYKDAKK